LHYSKSNLLIKTGSEGPRSIGQGKILFCLSVIFFLSALFIFPGPSRLFASDYILGQVVSVDRQKGEFVLRVKQPVALEKDKNSSENRDDDMVQEQDKSTLITVQLSDTDGRQPFLPGAVRPGEFVRIWGSFIDTERHEFQAVDVRGTRNWSTDRSGVRSRLERGFQFRQGTGTRRGGRGRGRR
jgi:hypothetical protein